MTIRLIRQQTQGKAVRGQLSLPFDPSNPHVYPTLENADFLIAPGTYPLRLTWSPRFQKLTPEVCDVPDRAGLRFIGVHKNFNFWGERRTRETYRCDEVASQSEGFERDDEHSQGCVLLEPGALANLKIFINRIKNLYDNEEVFIEIADGSTDA